MITRSSGLQSKFDAGLVGVDKAALVLIALGAGNVRLTDYQHSLVWPSDTYEATAGGLLDVQLIRNQGRNVANAAVLIFGEAMRVTLLGANVRNRRVAVWEAWVMAGAVVDAILRFDGLLRLGQASDQSGIGWTVEVRSEDLWRDQRNTTLASRTREGQQAIFPADDGLDNVAAMSEKSRIYGGAGVKVWR